MTNKRLSQLQKDLQELGIYAQEAYPQFSNAIGVRAGSLVSSIEQMKNTRPTPKKGKGPNTDTIQA